MGKQNEHRSLTVNPPGKAPMTMDELRRQFATTDWPIVLRVDSKEIHVGSPEELLVPRAGNRICVYREGAFEVIDSRQIATLRHVQSTRRQTS